MTATARLDAEEHVLVTGASGFIGGAVAARLVGTGVHVTPSARGRTAQLSVELGTQVATLDVMGELPDLTGVSTLIHTATPNDIVSREMDGGLPLAVAGTNRLLAHAARSGVRRVVYFSTVQVYGTELAGHVTEETPVSCETLYALNHFLGEEVCRYYALTAGLDVAVLRPSNAYGLPATSTVDRWTLVPMCFVREALQTGEIVLRSSGRQQRNFISLDEVADAVVRLIAEFPTGYTVVNVGSSWQASVAEIAGMVEAALAQRADRRPTVRTLSNEPRETTQFTYASRIAPARLTPEQSRERMMSVIHALLQREQSVRP